MKKKEEPTKEQKKRFTKAFKYGKIEHKLETWTTYILLLGVLIQIIAIWSRKWTYCIVAAGFFGVALIFRVGAGISHKIEKHYMRYLRFGHWRREKK